MSLPKPNESVRSKASIAEVLNTAVQPAASLLNSLQSTSQLAKLPATATTSPSPASTPVATSVISSPAPQTSAPSTADSVQSPTTTAPTPAQPDTSIASAVPASQSPTIVAPVSPVPIAPARPNFTQRPSWIGPPRPDRPVTPGIANMKQPVVVEYASKGLQPPVYVFTSLSDPQWNAVEMDSERKDNGEYRFYKAFQAEEGEYQYKFRLGPGDWWALDEGKPMVDDEQSNKNNQLVVKAAPVIKQTAAAAQQKDRQPEASTPQVSQPSIPLPASLAKPVGSVQAAFQPVVEAVKKPIPPTIKLPTADPADPPFATPTAETPAVAPLLKHESFFAEEKSAADNGDVPPQWEVDDADVKPLEDNNEEDDGEDDDDDEHDDEPDEHTSPLLRHESLGPDIEHHAPLMRHETAGYGEHYDDEDVFSSRKASSASSAENPVAPEADPNDPTLEKFPTGKKAILDHIHRVSSGLHADGTLINAHHGPAVVDEFGSPLSSLASVQEDEEEEPNPPKITLTQPAGPITPPLTPQELDTIVQHAEDREKAEEVEGLMAERIIKRQKEALAKEKREEVIAETVQDRGLFGMVMDVASSPFTILAIAGIALAVAAGYWKLRYASESQ